MHRIVSAYTSALSHHSHSHTSTTSADDLVRSLFPVSLGSSFECRGIQQDPDAVRATDGVTPIRTFC